jgi:Prealbumin-like fold domain
MSRAPARQRTGRLPLAVLALLAILAVACGPDEAASPTPTVTVVDSGIQGTVLLGPTCPVQSVDASPCVTPYVAKLVILDSDGNVVTEVSSNPDGTFKVSLPPGDYVIQPMAPDGGIPNATAQSVTVAPHEYFDVEIDYDTGIR